VRLTLWYVALLALTLVAFSAFLYGSLARNLHAAIDTALTTQAQQILQTLDDERPSLTDAGDRIAPEMLVALYDRTGTRLLGGFARQMKPDNKSALAAAAQGRQTIETVALVGSLEARRLTMPVLQPGQVIAVLQVVRPERDVAAALHKLLLLMGVAIPLTLLCAVAGGLFLAGRALTPIDRITVAAAHIDADDLSQRINFQGDMDEAGRLAATFDHMLARLEAAFRRERRFTADASHELRTPLTILTSEVDVALERPHSAAHYRQVLRSVREDASRMDQLLSQLLTLARADAGHAALVRERLALTDLADEVVRTMEPLAAMRDVRLVYAGSSQSPEAVVVDGDQSRLIQLLMNLIENGLKYTPAGGSVSVAVRRATAWAIIDVADTGVGITPEHLPHVFDRFYRADKARAREAGGTGLGLAISQWIVQAHGGTIGVASAPGRGTTFTVRLPLAAPSLTGNQPPPEMGLRVTGISE
jgi:heavy metal sensor kinase